LHELINIYLEEINKEKKRKRRETAPATREQLAHSIEEASDRWRA
jgi:hypothetical protein